VKEIKKKKTTNSTKKKTKKTKTCDGRKTIVSHSENKDWLNSQINEGVRCEAKEEKQVGGNAENRSEKAL